MEELHSQTFAIVVGIFVFLIAVCPMLWNVYGPAPKTRPAEIPRRLDATDPKYYFSAEEPDLYWHAEDPMMMRRERIAGVAHRHPNGFIYWATPPLRHHHLFNDHLAPLGLAGLVNTTPSRQGFITSHGRFVNREDGWTVAELASQIVRVTGPKGELFSEDLWL